MKTIEINGHNVNIEGVHSRISFFAISKAVGIEGKGLITFIFDGVTYKPSHYYRNRPYYDNKISKIDTGKILIEKIN